MTHWYYEKMKEFQEETKNLPASEGRAAQIVKWLSRPNSCFIEQIHKSLYSLDEAEALEFLTKHYSKIAFVGFPLISEDMGFRRELTNDIFGSRCNSYEFMIIHLDADYNLMVRRKCDSITLTAKFQEPLRRAICSGTYSPDYRCWLMIKAFKCFTFEDINFDEF